MAMLGGMIERIPIVLLTGFLGSGKTTLLARALKEPAANDTVVLINEFGAVGLDHELLMRGGGISLLENGCICCTVGDDLISLLTDLFWQRLHRKLRRFNRVIVETTGLADPRPVVAALVSNALIGQRYRYAGTLCVVDAMAGLGDIDVYREAQAQVAVADLVVISKTDRASPEAYDAVKQRVAAINPQASIVNSANGEAGTSGLFDAVAAQNLLDQSIAVAMQQHEPRRHSSVASLVAPLRPVADWSAIEAGLHTLAGATDVLRVKGVAWVGGAPVVVQMVGATLSPPEPFTGDTTNFKRGLLVVIGRAMTEAAVWAALGDLVAQPNAS